MKAMILTVAAAAALTTGAATAQPYGNGRWVSINERQAQLDRRIDQGVRSGQLTRREAYHLRTEFRDIARLETRYRSNGLSRWERADLDRRFDQLAAQVRSERRDGQRYGYNEYRR